jgi:hypothetical protein
VSDSEEQILDGDSDLEFKESDGDDSGSEFQESDPSESDYAPSPRSKKSTRSLKFNSPSDDEVDESNGPLVLDAAMDDAEEEADVEAAIMASIMTGSEHVNGPTTGSAPTKNSTRGTAAALRALAAEKRLRQGHVIDDRNAEDLTSLASSDEESVPAKTKKKGKSGKSNTSVADTSEKEHMTLLEMRLMRREAKHALRIQQAPLKREEMILRRELGRKLTYVGPSS